MFFSKVNFGCLCVSELMDFQYLNFNFTVEVKMTKT